MVITVITKLSEAENALLDLRRPYRYDQHEDSDYKVIDDAFESISDFGTIFNDMLNCIEKKMLMERMNND